MLVKMVKMLELELGLICKMLDYLLLQRKLYRVVDRVGKKTETDDGEAAISVDGALLDLEVLQNLLCPLYQQ